jgi:hypothetical protein
MALQYIHIHVHYITFSHEILVLFSSHLPPTNVHYINQNHRGGIIDLIRVADLSILVQEWTSSGMWVGIVEVDCRVR